MISRSPLALLPVFAALVLAGCRPSSKTAESAAAPAEASKPAAGTKSFAETPKPVAEAKPVAEPKSSGGLHASIDTDKGTIELEFLVNDAPKAVENFRLLTERGYYNGVTFHRIVKGFMLQGGDPQGDGRGGESAWGGTFADEINRNSDLYRRGYRRGLVAMANMGPNTNGSQFFIMHQDYPLQPNYVIFAQVVKGMEVVDALAATLTGPGMDGAMSRPLTPVVMRKVTIKP